MSMGSIVLKIHAEMPQTSPDQIELRNAEIRDEVVKRLKQVAPGYATVKGVKNTDLRNSTFVAFRATFESDHLKSLGDFDPILLKISNMIVDDFGLTLKPYDFINPAIEIGFHDRRILGDLI
jgi:hypothetical protein